MREFIKISTLLALLFYCNIIVAQNVERTDLDNPNATPETVYLYRYLQDLTYGNYDSKLISGHWAGGSFRPGQNNYPFNMGEFTEIRRQSGKWIGMLDSWICCGEFGTPEGSDAIEDCMYYGHMIPDYILWWKNGGICHVDASFYAPLKDCYGSRHLKTHVHPVNPLNILREGTPENKRWMALIDRMSDFFLALQKYDVPVIFRPFTEPYVKQFWYSDGYLKNSEFIALYRHMHWYMTQVKGCNNIIWDFQGDHSDGYWPGDDVVDLITTRSEYLEYHKHGLYLEENTGMPAGNGELGDYGPSFTIKGSNHRTWNSYIDNAKKNCPELSFYITWDRHWGPVQEMTKQGEYGNYHIEYNQALQNPYLLTRDELLPLGKVNYPLEGELIHAMELSDCFGGKWAEENGYFSRTDADGEALAFHGSTDWTDYEVVAELASKGVAGIAGRYVSGNIYYKLYAGNGTAVVSKVFNGVETILSQKKFASKKGEFLEMSMKFNGSRIRASVKSAQRSVSFYVKDVSIPAGCVALYSKSCKISARKLYIKNY